MTEKAALLAMAEAVCHPAGTMTDAATDRAAAPADALPLTHASNWRSTLWAMVGIQFIMTMSFSFLTPIMPLFLPVLGVHDEAAIDMWAGVLAGSTSFVAAFASPLWGRLADQHGRKLMLLRSSCAIAIFTALMGLSQNVWECFAARGLMGVFAGFSSTAMALVASQVPEGRLGYSLGLLSTGQLVGSLVGPVVGGVLSDLTGSYRIPFYCTSAICFTALALVWLGVQEEFVRPPADKRKGSTWRNMRLHARRNRHAAVVLCPVDGAIQHARRAAGRDVVRAATDRAET